MSLVDVHGVTKRFGATTAVDEVSFVVEPGEVVGLLGANGAGKTTIMRMLLGLLRPTAGAIEVAGAPVTAATRRRLGYVPQGLGLYRELTVAENLAFAADAHGVPRPDPGPDLSRVANRRVADVSLGLRRRTAFEAATCHAPDLLVLDEPTSGVGPLGRARLWETIRERAEIGAGVLVSTHYMEEAEECDRVFLMAQGSEVATGTVDALLGGRTSVAVAGTDPVAIQRLRDAGFVVIAAGDGWRVPEAGLADVQRVVGPDVGCHEVPATFDEVFVDLAT